MADENNTNDVVVEDLSQEELDALLAEAEASEKRALEERKSDPVQLKKDLEKYKSNLKFAKDAESKATIQKHIDDIQGTLDGLDEAKKNDDTEDGVDNSDSDSEDGVEDEDDDDTEDGVDEAFGKKDDDTDDDADGKDDDNDGEEDDDKKPAFIKKESFADDLTALTEGDESLSEDFKAKAAIIFEAALTTRVREEQARLQEEFDNKIIEETSKIAESLEEKIDNYLTYAVESWVEDNKIAIEGGLRTEVAESFIDALKNVFVEHYIEVPETKKDIVSELETKLTVAEEALCESGNKAKVLAEEVEKLQRDKILAEASESLADTQAARLHDLAQDVEFVNEETFRKKVSTIKGVYFKGKATMIEEQAKPAHVSTEVIVEDNDGSDLSPSMQATLKTLARINKANNLSRSN